MFCVQEVSISINVLAAAGDVLIAVVLCSMLQKSRTGFQESDTMINKLIIFTMNTGLLTSLCAVASFISILAAPNTFIYIAFFFNIGRFYSNTLMATLNARRGVRSTGSDDAMTVSLQRFKQGSSMVNSKVNPTRMVRALEWIILIRYDPLATEQQHCDQGGHCSRILAGQCFYGP